MTDQTAPQPNRPFFFSLKTTALKLVAVAIIVPAVASVAFLNLDFSLALTTSLLFLCVALWATALVPEYWTAFLFFFLAVTLGIAPNEVIFSGFVSSTFWLLFGGLVIGASLKFTGLGKKAALLLSKFLGDRYFSMIGGIVFFGVALAFVMPSSVGRVVLLIPVLSALADHMGYEETSNGRMGMITAGTIGTFLPAFTILPANVPNMMLSGMAENLYKIDLSYGEYLLLHFPVLGFLKSLFLIAVILWLFPSPSPEWSTSVKTEKSNPYSQKEIFLTVILGLCLLLWLTDSLHGISPGWIGFGAAIVCLFPGFKLTQPGAINSEINYGSLFFVAGIIGLGSVLSDSGIGEMMVEKLLGNTGLSTDQPVLNGYIITGLSSIVGIATNLPGIPAVMTPMAEKLVEATGLSLMAILMTQVLAFSSVFLPYQAPPLVTAIQVGKLPFGKISALCLIMFVISITILIPLEMLWWQFLGLI